MIPWITIIGAIPLVASLGVATLPKGQDELAKRVTLGTTLTVLFLVVVVALRFDPSGERFQFTEVYSWIPQFGVHYAVGVDGIALVLILLSALLMPLVVLASWHDAEGGRGDSSDPAPRRSVKTYFTLLLVLEAMMIGVFAATDVFLFYVFFEAMLVPMYFMIGSYGGPQRSYAAVKFLLYSLFGGLLMLVALIGLYVLAGKNSFLFDQLRGVPLDPAVAKWLFLGFFIAFAIKAPLWPFHTWLPDAAAQAPAGAAVLLVGVLDKVGTFGMLRYCLELFPGASKFFTPLVIALALIGIVYGAIVAIGQADIKRLIAYTSVSHFGFIGLGIFAMTAQAQSGATFYMVNHGLATGALFLIAGFLISRRRSAYIDDYGGMQSVTPLLAGMFLIAGLATLSLPGLAPFVSEFLVLVGTFPRYAAPAVIGAVGMILAAVYILWLYQRTMNGPTKGSVRGLPDLNGRELGALAPLIGLLIVLGFFPKPVLDVINPAVRDVLSNSVRVNDPPPLVPGAAGEQGTAWFAYVPLPDQKGPGK